MIKTWLGYLGIIIFLGVLVVGGLAGIATYNAWYQSTYKSPVQTLEAPGENVQFVLLTDVSGREDRAWYVYQTPIGAEIDSRVETGHDTKGALFWNHSESGAHQGNPKIEILQGRFLVFSRGGLYHSLYDLRQQAVLVNDPNPWSSFQKSVQAGNQAQPGAAQAAMDAWVRDNLHRKIEAIIKGTI